MTSFRAGEDDLQHPLDWRLLQNSPVTLYLRRKYLETDIDELAAIGYAVHQFDCASWSSWDAMHADFKRELRFPEYYGANLNALRDCLSDLAIPEPGIVVAFLNFHQHPEHPDAMLEAFADSARYRMLFGDRLIILLQTDDPHYTGPADLAATPAQWNGREWLTANRLGDDD